MQYDFSKLSGIDFEELVHDLLEQEWGTSLEIFRNGPDGGVDLRVPDGNGWLIVQCKNFARSPFPTLRARMRDDELPKIRRLAPRRYVLVTSLELTVGQKDELALLLNPHARTSSDIVGGNELEAMLGRHPEVVRRHYKLWMASIAVLERILHAAEFEQTRTHVERIGRKLPLFVQTQAYGRAMEILDANRFVIITGGPGIGKSTLADMLMYSHMADGFVPAVIRDRLADGRRMVSSGKPTFFYFDDFLGQTHLGDRPDFLGRREDADLVDFIEWVRGHPAHRFVLTTREHILADALGRSEKLRHSGIVDGRCVVDIGDFRRSHRARILYNHLHFSRIPAEHRIELIRDDFFLKIVDSKSFNPRIVEWLSSDRRLKTVTAAGYRDYVSTLLGDPREIWRHAFREELSQAARDVLLSIQSLSYVVYVDDLEKAFDRLHELSMRRTNGRSSIGAYRSALKELDGAFIAIGNDRVEFINPSVRDFMATVIEEDPGMALDVVDAAVRFNQLINIWAGSAPEGPHPSARGLLQSKPQRLADALDRLLEAPETRWFPKGRGSVGYFVDQSMPLRIEHLNEMSKALPAIRPLLLRAIAIVAGSIGERQIALHDVVPLLEAAFASPSERDLEDLTPMIAAMELAMAEAGAEEWLALLDLRKAVGDPFHRRINAGRFSNGLEAYVDDGPEAEMDGMRNVDDLEHLKRTMESLRDRHGLPLDSDIARVEDLLNQGADEAPSVQSTGGRHIRKNATPDIDDELLRRMFSRLVET